MKTKTPLLWILALVFALAAPSGQAQSIGELFDGSIRDMQAEKWQDAITKIDKIIENYGENAKEIHGAKFGMIYYRKGMCLMKLGDLSGAIKNFKTCHEDFPNPKEVKDSETTNPTYEMAVLQWASCEQQLSNFAEAAKLYKKFISLGAKKGYSKSALYLNLGNCLARSGAVVEGEKYIGAVFDSSGKVNLDKSLMWQGMIGLANGYVENDLEKEANAFLDKHQGKLVSSDLWKTFPQAGAMVKLGKDAGEKGLYDLELRLYSLVPQTIAARDELISMNDSRLTKSDKISAAVAKFQAKLDSADPPEIDNLMLVARAYARQNNNRAGFVVYEHLTRHYPKSSRRADILYATSAMAAATQRMDKAQSYGLMFMDEFPENPLKSKVAVLLLESMFWKGEYDQCIEIATKIREELPAGSPDRDLPDFAYGGSKYYLGDTQVAQEELDLHAETYPKSKYAEFVQYYRGSNLIRLYEWQKAAEMLDTFIKKYPESVMMDLALFDRSTCWFSVADDTNGGLSEARDLITRIEKEYPDSNVLDRAVNLRADIYNSESKLKEAKEDYLKGLALSEARRNTQVAANSLSQLVTVCAGLKEYEESATYYDKFFKSGKGYEDTFYAPMTAVEGLKALKEVGRTQDALTILEDLIVKMGQQTDADIEKAINSYSEFYSGELGSEKLISKLENFPEQHNIPLTNYTIRSWLLISIINELEKPKNMELLQAKKKVAYGQLEKFPKDKMAPYILAKVGINMAKVEATRFKAVPWFEAVLANPDGIEHHDMALLEMAKIKQASPNAASKKEALVNLDRVLNDFEDPDLKEEATLYKARIYYDLGDFESAKKAFSEYRKNKNWNLARPEVTFKYAETQEKTGAPKPDVLAGYMQVYVLYPTHLEYSTKAMLRLAKLGDDKKKVYEILRDYLPRMELQKSNPNVMEAQRIFDELEPTYGNPDGQ